MQLALQYDLVHQKENNPESRAILETNREHLNKQCKKVLELFEKGYRLTTGRALLLFQIGDLRARVRDLRDAGYDVKDELLKGRYKKYWIEGPQ